MRANETKIFIMNFVFFHTLVMFAPLYSQSSENGQKSLNTIRLSGRFNELESQDGYNIGAAYARQIGSFKLGFGFDIHTLISGVWAGLDLRYQTLNSKRGVGLSYARLLDEKEQKLDYVTPIIVYMNFEVVPLFDIKKGLGIEMRPGFDLPYLNPPGGALLGPLTGFIYGSSISLDLKF